MTKIEEVLGVFVIGGVMSVIMYAAAGENGKPSRTEVQPTPPIVEPAEPAAPAEAAPLAVELLDQDTRVPEVADPLESQRVYFYTDTAAAEKVARERGKPLVRLVTSPANCVYCRVLEQGPLSDPDTIRWLNRNTVMLMRSPYRGEGGGIPRLEIQTGPRQWRVVSIPSYDPVKFLNWFQWLVR